VELKNVLFRVSRGGFSLRLHDLEKIASAVKFGELQPKEESRAGFVNPVNYEDCENFVAEANEHFTICLRTDTKSIPPAALKKTLNKLIRAHTSAKGSPPSKAQKNELKFAAKAELLPKALINTKLLYAHFDLVAGRLLVETTSAKAVDDLITLLCKGGMTTEQSGGLSALQTKGSPDTVLSSWVEVGHPSIAAFSFSQSCIMVEPVEKGPLAKVDRHDLSAEEVIHHINAGKLVREIGLHWAERLSFVLTRELGIKKLCSLGLIRNELKDASTGADPAKADEARFSILSSLIRMMLSEVLEAMGGLNLQATHPQ
jgi:recombination associated protein RdgC